MTVCANRTDDPGFFRSCVDANHNACVCGAQVLAETIAAEKQAAPCPECLNGYHEACSDLAETAASCECGFCGTCTG